jgi:phenylacetate-coenzyme A ligase PaaK-like adenylate-forming protein
MQDQWNHKIFEVNEEDFEALALEIFRYQARENKTYGSFINALGRDTRKIKTIKDIPFLPVSFFKTHSVRSGSFEPSMIFESSGTTGTSTSRHAVKDLDLYERSFTRSVELFYGPVKDHCIIGLLPSYLERQNSSLVWMVNRLIELSGHSMSGFYLDDLEKLNSTLIELENSGQKTFLIGVTFALLDLAEKYPITLRNTMVMETGGMKGRREEMVREEVHHILKNAFKVEKIHSEYGMTELMSQAYSNGDGIFRSPPWMRIILRDDEDPFLLKTTGSGSVNIIDLANIHSCSFIATDDIGRTFSDGSFEIIGRIDGSDMRGCSLLVV